MNTHECDSTRPAMACLPRLAAALLLAATLTAACDSHGPDGDHDHAGETGHEDHAEGPDHDHDHDHDHEHDQDDHDGHADEHGDEHGHEHEAGEPDFAAIRPAEASHHGIGIATAAPGTLAEKLTLTGRLMIDPAHVALVSARFPGPVLAVTKTVGEPVKKGEVLARVESNESLSVYDVRSPLTGVVLERMTNVGDVAGSGPLFRVGDPEALLAELSVFPSQQSLVKPGAPVRVQLGSGAGAAELTGQVLAIVPELEGHTQALRVRVALDRPEGAPMPGTPGQFVTAEISVSTDTADVVVPAAALLRLEGREVVFVPETEGFRARPVRVGTRTPDQVVIEEGLAAGEQYVSRGAFILKAEIGKHLAEHTH